MGRPMMNPHLFIHLLLYLLILTANLALIEFHSKMIKKSVFQRAETFMTPKSSA